MCPCLYHAAHKAFLLPARNLGDELPAELSIKDSALGNIKIFQIVSYPHLGIPTIGVGHAVTSCAELTQSPLVQHYDHWRQPEDVKKDKPAVSS